MSSAGRLVVGLFLVCAIGRLSAREPVRYLEIGDDCFPICKVDDAGIFMSMVEARLPKAMLEKREDLKNADQWDEAHQAEFNKTYAPAFRDAFRAAIAEELTIASVRGRWTKENERAYRALQEQWKDNDYKPIPGLEYPEVFKRRTLLAYFNAHPPKDWNADDPVTRAKARKAWLKAELGKHKVLGIREGRDAPIPAWLILDEPNPDEANPADMKSKKEEEP
ncbi:MAG: hypothetical protein KIS92_13535 [Planctomycetota bacterium]|nr:hypothetical protein [Planctomycetota bacterium]